MAAKRQGLFGKASRTPRPRESAKAAALSPLAGLTYRWDLASDALNWGPNASQVLGLAPQDLPATGEAFAHLVEPGCGPSRQEALADAGLKGTFDTRYALRLEANRVLMVQDCGRCLPGPGGAPLIVRGQIRLEAAEASNPLPAMVRARSELLCRLQGGVNEALLQSQACTLIVGAFEDEEIDTLADLPRILRPMMRRTDHFAVLGARRFAVLLAACPAEHAASAMRRLSGLLQAHSAHGSLRLGSASSPDHTFQAMKLLRFAERALAAAAAHDEPALAYDPAHFVPQAAEDAIFDPVADLNQRRLVLALQPVVDAHNRLPHLLQACAALPGADGHPVPLPALPTLDEAHLALLVDGRLLELAADHLARHPDRHLILSVSPATLHDPEWLDMLAAHLGARPGIASRLMIGVPEAVLVDAPAARGRFDAMKALGVGIALSGFGAGHALPAHLQILPIDLLVLDGVFVQPLQRSTDDRQHVRTLVDRAHHLGIVTMAEWVDDDATALMLADWGVDYLQGALFGAPEAASMPSTRDLILRRA